MNHLSLFFALVIFLSLSFIFYGFQCSSPQMTTAKLNIQRSEWANAEKSLKEEVQKNPDNAEAWYLLGDVRRNLENFEGMIQAFDQSLKLSNEYAKKIDDTKKFIWTKWLKSGVDNYNKSINMPKEAASAARQQAIKGYQTAILIYPDSTLAYENLAIAYRAEGNYDNEILTYKQILQHKADPKISVSLINAYLRKSDFAKSSGNKAEQEVNLNNAIQAINEARKTDPDNLELLGTLINVYIEADRAKEAVPLMRESLQKDPNNKVFQYDLGLLLMQDNQIEESIQHYEAALAIDKNYEEALRNGAVAYMKLGEKMKEDAQAKYDPKGKKELDKSYQEKFKKASVLLESLITLKSDEPRLWDALATAYGNAGIIKKAEEAVKKADELRKQKP